MSRGIKHGTTAIFDLNTRIYTPTPIGENAPQDCDLQEHQELYAWDETVDAWVVPPVAPLTKAHKQKKLLASIKADWEQVEQHETEAEAWRSESWKKWQELLESLDDE